MAATASPHHDAKVVPEHQIERGFTPQPAATRACILRARGYGNRREPPDFRSEAFILPRYVRFARALALVGCGGDTRTQADSSTNYLQSKV
jgi:hypothetical protein